MKKYQQKYKATREFLSDVPDAENILIRQSIHKMLDNMDMDDIKDLFDISVIGYDMQIHADQPHWMQEAIFQMKQQGMKEYTITIKHNANIQL